MHSDFDRARQVSHYWRARGAKTVIGGAFASSYPKLVLWENGAVTIVVAGAALRETKSDSARRPVGAHDLRNRFTRSKDTPGYAVPGSLAYQSTLRVTIIASAIRPKINSEPRSRAMSSAISRP